MATRTSAKSGRRRPVSSAGKRGLGKVAGNARRGWKKTLRRHPSVGVLASILLGIVAVVSLLLGVILESALYYLVMAMSALGALAIRRAQQMARERHAAPPPRARPTTGGPRKPPPPKPADATPPPATGPVKCTETSKPIDTCGCSSRHVASEQGARRYGRPVGTPMGKRAKQGKPPMTRSGAAD